jgi:iron-sulfur cluster assembly protein
MRPPIPNREADYMLNITDTAVRAVKRTIEDNQMPAETFLRVLIKSGGCSGLSYDMKFEAAAEESDRVIEKDGVRLLIDPRSEIYLAGTELDFESGLKGQGFVFRNPNASGGCGCGKSFSA